MILGHLQQEILRVLTESQPLYFGELRRRVYRDWSTVHQSIERLKARGLVTECPGQMIQKTHGGENNG